MAGQRSVTLRFLAAPTDANARGRVDGGKALEWIDKAGYACAVAWSGTYCVTSYVGNIHFARPVGVGDLVEVEARIVYVGRTSMHVLCTVSSGPVASGETQLATQCILHFVAMGPDGRPTPVPPWTPETDLERREQARAASLIDVRKRIEADMARQRYTDETRACRETLRFLAAPSDVNWGGKVHGGYVMAWIGQAAQLVAERWHGGPAVLVYAGGFRFYRPLRIGDVVEVEARLIHTGTTSMHVSVHVRGGAPVAGELETTTHGMLVLVAVDADGVKQAVPTWRPELPEDVALDEHALHVIDYRKQLLRPGPVETDAPRD